MKQVFIESLEDIGRLRMINMLLTFFNIDKNYLHLEYTLLIFTVKVHLNKSIYIYIYNQYLGFKNESHILKVIYRISSNKCPGRSIQI